MNINLKCFDKLDSIYLTNRAYETKYEYNALYAVQPSTLIESGIEEESSILCRHCGEPVKILQLSKPKVLALQLLIWLSMPILTGLAFLFTFQATREANNTFGTFGIIFFILSLMSMYVTFDIRRYEFETRFRIKNKERVKVEGEKVWFSRHRVEEQDYVPLFGKLYTVLRVVYFLWISVYSYSLVDLVIIKSSTGKAIILYFAFVVVMGLPLYLGINYLYDKKWKKRVRIR